MATAIEFDHVGKQYRLGLVSTRTLSHDLDRWWQTSVLKKEDPYLKIGETNDRSKFGNSEYVWALKDIDFKVEQGDVVGIIGKNGAGKSTLLKLLSKVTGPTVGTIRARGRIGSLLEVGTGFHPEMTGRENIYMNGAILGMTKADIGRKLDEIISFSGCERYIDTPVKRYSSGMKVRLGFAVAAFMEPEILVVDEVLAVGDAEFQKKAIGKMQDVSKGEGRTVLFVSHNMASIRSLCRHGVLLENGMTKSIGEVNDIVDLYLESQFKTGESFFDNMQSCAPYLKVHGIYVNGSETNPIKLSPSNSVVNIHIDGELTIDTHVAMEFRLTDKNGIPLAFYSPSHYSGTVPFMEKGSFELDYDIHFPETMNHGIFYGSLFLSDPGKRYHLQMNNAIRISSEGFPMKTGLVFNYNKGNGLVFLK